MLNSPQKVPSPGSAALQEALNLIAGLGSGDKNLKAMLEEMRKVQEHNAQVAQEAVVEVGKIKKQRDQFDEEMSEKLGEYDKKVSEYGKKLSELQNDVLAFEKEKTDFHDRYRVKEADYLQKHGALVQSEMELARDQGRVKNESAVLETLRKQLDERESEIKKMEGNLYAIQEYLKAHL